MHVCVPGIVSQQGVPNELPVVTRQLEVTPLERACTCVGTSSQSLFESKRKPAVTWLSRPSSVGMGPLKLLLSKVWGGAERA